MSTTLAVRWASAAWLLAALAWPGMAAAQLAVPPLTAHLSDQTATLSPEQKAALEQTLQAFEARKGSQLAVLMVATTAPEAIEQYALRVAEQWRLGRKNIDDGAILVIAKNDRTVRLEVGYGLEGALNDATSKRIISETIVPYFKQADFYGGISAGVGQIIQVIDGEPLPKPEPLKTAKGVAGIQQYAPVMLIFALVIGGVFHNTLGRFPGALATGGVVALVTWLFASAIPIALLAGVMALLFTLLSGGIGWRGIGSRYAGNGMAGLGRGGFGGGGGGFGGGGASGRW